MNRKSTLSTNRTIYFDYLRVFATFAVMILHISAQNFYSTDVNGFQWQVFNFFDSIVRWSVPVFVMISGALFLSRDIPVRKIYSKYILRLVISFIVWSFIYAVAFKGGSIRYRISMLINGHYHMWFVLMIIGIYMCLPFIKGIADNNKRTKYYLLLAFIFAFLFPTLVTLAKDFAGNLIYAGVSALNYDVNAMDIDILLGFTSYFILGHFLNKIDFSARQRTVIYILGIIGFVSTIALNSIVSLNAQEQLQNYCGNFSVNILLESIAVFTFFKYRNWERKRSYPIVLKLSQYSYGAYLVHALVIEQLNTALGLNTLSFNPILSVIVIGIIVFIVSFSVSGILNHIPVIKKFAV